MKQNVGFIDKIIRLVIAGILIGLFAAGIITDILGFLLLILGIVLIFTCLFSYCGLYGLLGISSCSNDKKKGS